jgi:hypothetical protein
VVSRSRRISRPIPCRRDGGRPASPPSEPEDRTRKFEPAEFAALDRASGRDSPADYLKALALRVIAASP